MAEPEVINLEHSDEEEAPATTPRTGRDVIAIDDDSQLEDSPGVEIIDVDAPTPPSPRGQKRKKDDKAAPAMRSGARPAASLNDVDQTFALNGEQATSAVRSVIDASADAVNRFRASRSSKETLWALLDGARQAKVGPVRPEVDATYANKLPRALVATSGERVASYSALLYARRRLAALEDKARHDAWCDNIETIDEGETCAVCMDTFKETDGVRCSKGDHFMCRACFRRYCVDVACDRGSGPSAVECVAPKCGAVYATRSVKDCVSAADVMVMEERERDKSLRQVLGGAAAVLRCPCGTVGAVSHEDVGDGRVACPGCQTAYCVRCGMAAHEGPCKDGEGGVLSWLAEKKGDVKQCPKCGEAIEKDAGCNHMKCACGHDFCWLCLGPFPNCKCGHFEEESRREAARLQQQDRRRDRYGEGYVYDPYGPFGGGPPGGDSDRALARAMELAERMQRPRGRGRGRGGRRRSGFDEGDMARAMAASMGQSFQGDGHRLGSGGPPTRSKKKSRR